MPPIHLSHQNTPNPDTRQYLPPTPFDMRGSREHLSKADSESSPLANVLFDIEGVERVFLTPHFVSVSKTSDTDWAELHVQIVRTISQHLENGQPVVTEDDSDNMDKEEEPLFDPQDADVVERIKALLDTHVRPAVAQDGGDITFQGFSQGIVFLRMKGACAGCPSSTMTLKMGIENLLRHKIPEVGSVRAV